MFWGAPRQAHDRVWSPPALNSSYLIVCSGREAHQVVGDIFSVFTSEPTPPQPEDEEDLAQETAGSMAFTVSDLEVCLQSSADSSRTSLVSLTPVLAASAVLTGVTDRISLLAEFDAASTAGLGWDAAAAFSAQSRGSSEGGERGDCRSSAPWLNGRLGCSGATFSFTVWSSAIPHSILLRRFPGRVPHRPPTRSWTARRPR